MANLQKKLTQENAPDLAQKLLLRDIKPDLDNFLGVILVNLLYLKNYLEYFRSV